MFSRRIKFVPDLYRLFPQFADYIRFIGSIDLRE